MNRAELIDEFRARAGWGDAVLEALPGDASFRRYFRLRLGDETAMLMDAPPPEEDVGPFLDVAEWLSQYGHRAPEIFAEDREQGLILQEDFGADRMRDWLDENPGEEKETYRKAMDALIALRTSPPGPFAPYDMPTYVREARLFTEWFCPAAGLEVDVTGYDAAWEEALGHMLERQEPSVTVLRDYHAENIMLLPDGAQGLIDFQDALAGHPAYDIVSLLQDARRDVSEDLEGEMLDYYRAKVIVGESFDADYARLGAQRNAKIVGIFTRLWKRDGKDRYLAMIPRVWNAMERDLKHPALEPVARWFDANIPDDMRAKAGAVLP